MKTWILVADEGRARLFEAGAADSELIEIAGFVHPEAHHPEAEVGDRLPRVQESASSVRHAIEPRTTEEAKQAEEFARGLCEVLDDGRVHHRYQRLVLIAAPRFLGRLREIMNPQVAKLVAHSADKDITKAGAEQIAEVLRAMG